MFMYFYPFHTLSTFHPFKLNLKDHHQYHYKYMLFTGREVRIGKNCARGLEYGPRPQAEGPTQDQGHSFSLYGPT